MRNTPYEIYAVDPNGDDQLLATTDFRYGEGGAIRLWIHYTQEYRGSGCSVEIWCDGTPLNEGEWQ